MNVSKRKVFFVEWDETFRMILKGVTLSDSLRGLVAVHVFFSSDLKVSAQPLYKPWILKHPVLTKSTEGLWQSMTSYISRFNFDANHCLTKDIQPRFHGNGASGKSPTTDKASCYVLTPSVERSGELARKVYQERNVHLEVIDGEEVSTLLDFLNYKCDICKVAFKKKGELQQHNQSVHGLTCLNANCHYNKKENAFNTETDLRRHIGSQRRCVFCPTKVFCSASLLDKHMKSAHKQCGCGCGKFFASRTAFLDHFFSTYPSPSDITSFPKQSELLKLSKCNKMQSGQQKGNANIVSPVNMVGESQPMLEKFDLDRNVDTTYDSAPEQFEELFNSRTPTEHSETPDMLQ